jgi:hypothetical protein
MHSSATCSPTSDLTQLGKNLFDSVMETWLAAILRSDLTVDLGPLKKARLVFPMISALLTPHGRSQRSSCQRRDKATFQSLGPAHEGVL